MVTWRGQERSLENKGPRGSKLDLSTCLGQKESIGFLFRGSVLIISKIGKKGGLEALVKGICLHVAPVSACRVL